MSQKISIIIPALNEGKEIVQTLNSLAVYRDMGHQIIVVDGGSDDGTAVLAQACADIVIVSTPGRARQMNAGAVQAAGDILLFLHADTHLPEGSMCLIKEAVHRSRWGRFDVRLSGRHWLLRIVENMMNWRSSLTGIATGDQAIFIQRDLFDEVGGFPEQPLMEDIEISKRLKRYAHPASIDTPLVTSSRRWEKGGVIRTILLMWKLRLLYWLGKDAESLVKMYR